MLESKAEHACWCNEEVANFVECGDARGPLWLARHPEARETAEHQLLVIASPRTEPDPLPVSSVRSWVT